MADHSAHDTSSHRVSSRDYQVKNRFAKQVGAFNTANRVEVDTLTKLIEQIRLEVEAFNKMERESREHLHSSIEGTQSTTDNRLSVMASRFGARHRLADETIVAVRDLRRRALAHEREMAADKLQSKRYMDYTSFRARLVAAEANIQRLAAFRLGVAADRHGVAVDADAEAAATEAAAAEATWLWAEEDKLLRSIGLKIEAAIASSVDRLLAGSYDDRLAKVAGHTATLRAELAEGGQHLMVANDGLSQTAVKNLPGGGPPLRRVRKSRPAMSRPQMSARGEGESRPTLPAGKPPRWPPGLTRPQTAPPARASTNAGRGDLSTIAPPGLDKWTSGLAKPA